MLFLVPTLRNAALTRHFLGREKQIIKKDEILEYCESDVDINSIGGLNNLKLWLEQAGAGFNEAAHELELSLQEACSCLVFLVPVEFDL